MDDPNKKPTTIDSLVKELTGQGSGSPAPRPQTPASLPPNLSTATPRPTQPAPTIMPKPLGTDLRFVNPNPGTLLTPKPATAPAPSPIATPKAPIPVDTSPILPKTPQLPSKSAEMPLNEPKETGSTLRTMTDDIARLKAGQMPGPVEKQQAPPPVAAPKPVMPTQPLPTPRPTPLPTAPLPPKPTAPVPAFPMQPRPVMPPPASAPTPAISIKPIETPKAPVIPAPTFGAPPTAPIRIDQIIVKQPTTSAPVTITSMPGASNSSRRFLYIIVGLIIIVILGGFYLLFKPGKEEVAILTPTPTPSISQTPIPTVTAVISHLNVIFGGFSENLQLDDQAVNPMDNLKTQLNQLIVNGGQVKKLLVGNAFNSELSPLALLDALRVIYPIELKTALNDGGVVLAYGQRESFDAQGKPILDAPVQNKLAFVIEIKDFNLLNQAVTKWESTLPDSLGKLFSIDKTKQSNPSFLGGTYQDASLRYKNFPYADKSIDYGVLLSGDKSYFIISSSRESVFSIINMLK